MDLRTVTYAATDSITRVVLNCPDQLNAISPLLLEDLDRVCDAVEHDAGVRSVTLTGAGRAFCAGADLRAVRELSPDPERWNGFMRLWHRVFNRIEALPVPVIAGVHGFALAGYRRGSAGPTIRWGSGSESRRPISPRGKITTEAMNSTPSPSSQ